MADANEKKIPVAVAAARIKEFLDDEVIQAVFASYEKNVTAEWRRSQNESQREMLHARLLGMDSMIAALRAIVDAAKVEAAQAERQARRETAADER